MLRFWCAAYFGAVFASLHTINNHVRPGRQLSLQTSEYFLEGSSKLQENDIPIPPESPSNQSIRPHLAAGNLIKRDPLPPYRAWEGGPIFANMPDTNIGRAVAHAFGDARKLALSAIVALCQVDPNGIESNLETIRYKRYFQMYELPLVKLHFGKILDAQVWTLASTHLRVSWGTRPVAWPGDAGTSCAEFPDRTALTANFFSATNQGEMLLCPKIFDPEWPASIEAAVRDDCRDIGTSADYHMETPGAVILHELMHWSGVNDAPDDDDVRWIFDFNAPYRRHYDPNQVPPNGYGPYNCMLVNSLHKLGSVNADSYLWFASESLFSQHCLVPSASGILEPRSFSAPLEDSENLPELPPIIAKRQTGGEGLEV